MSSQTRVVMNWSSGKDAALAYHLISRMEGHKVTQLLTTLSAEHGRVFMHGVREQLLDMQAERMRLPLTKVKLPASPDDGLYQQAMKEHLLAMKAEGVSVAAFGDIFLEDLRLCRAQQLAQVDIAALFPLWKKDTRELVEVVENSGIEAIITCVNEKYLGKEFLGRKIGREFLAGLPSGVDPCGENGEFHTFVYNAPFFSVPIPVKTGEVVHKNYSSGDGKWDTGFYFLDVMLHK
ncbi:MAG: diphthine--ammonia ligase [Flavipsychrobacter sp.]|jgi:uncharacterized protein (TIGR00290 family)|nr:diphthine--ammonia ligase [Flavipsychrobacter sp.]